MPFLKIVPTTGVTEENCQEYMGAGVFGVSFTAVLFDPEDMQHKRFDRIEVRHEGRKNALCVFTFNSSVFRFAFRLKKVM